MAERKGVALASVDGEIDLATPQGRLTARIEGSVAKHETEQLTRRVKAEMAERAESGAPHGRTAYGWRREQLYDEQGRRWGPRDVLHPEQAAVIRASATGVLAGDSLRAIVARLNARGEVTLDKTWTTTTLRLILLRERNAGLRVHQGQVIGQEELGSRPGHQHLQPVRLRPRTAPSNTYCQDWRDAALRRPDAGPGRFTRQRPDPRQRTPTASAAPGRPPNRTPVGNLFARSPAVLASALSTPNRPATTSRASNSCAVL